MTADSSFPADGGCACRLVRYRMETKPLVVHCCHCRWCQRESGAAFGLNALIEADRVVHLGQEPEQVVTPSASGASQVIARCPACKVAVWSNYAGAGPFVRFVRVGTLDHPDLLPPDIHIFTESKQPWLVLPATTPAVTEYYQREKFWSRESLARRAALDPLIDKYQAGIGSSAAGSANRETAAPAEDPRLPSGNLYAGDTPPATGERFDELLRYRNLLVERITSSARITPEWMSQDQDEWVVLLRGSATLEVDDVDRPMAAGDYLFLPAGMPHRVRRVSEGALWLAVHLHPAR